VDRDRRSDRYRCLVNDTQTAEEFLKIRGCYRLEPRRFGQAILDRWTDGAMPPNIVTFIRTPSGKVLEPTRSDAAFFESLSEIASLIHDIPEYLQLFNLIDPYGRHAPRTLLSYAIHLAPHWQAPTIKDDALVFIAENHRPCTVERFRCTSNGKIEVKTLRRAQI